MSVRLKNYKVVIVLCAKKTPVYVYAGVFAFREKQKLV